MENGRVWWGGGRGLDSQAAVMISHSLPDLSRSVSQELLLPHDNKKVRVRLQGTGLCGMIMYREEMIMETEKRGRYE